LNPSVRYFADFLAAVFFFAATGFAVDLLDPDFLAEVFAAVFFLPLAPVSGSSPMVFASAGRFFSATVIKTFDIRR
jgi:hypothetical protein